MQHRRPRLMAKILAFVLAVSLVFPVSAFASVADLADDTRVPGKYLPQPAGRLAGISG